MEKQEPVAEDVQILNKINRRLDTIEETNKKLTNTQNDQQQILNNHKTNQKEEIKIFQNECKEISKEIKELTKNIFHIGKQLKDKITKDEIKYLKAEIDNWPLEKYITKKELNKTYNQYSK